MSQFSRSDIEFQSQGVTCRAWYYQPEQADGATIIMGHGLGGTREAGLQPFAECFAENGYRVVLFDYRHFGASDGEPRQLLSISKQLADWQAAVAHSRSLPGVDPKEPAEQCAFAFARVYGIARGPKSNRREALA